MVVTAPEPSGVAPRRQLSDMAGNPGFHTTHTGVHSPHFTNAVAWAEPRALDHPYRGLEPWVP